MECRTQKRKLFAFKKLLGLLRSLSKNELLRPQRLKDLPSWKLREPKKPDCRPKRLLLSSLDGRPRKKNRLVSNLSRQWLS